MIYLLVGSLGFLGIGLWAWFAPGSFTVDPYQDSEEIR